MSRTCIQTAEYRYGQVTAAGARARIHSRVHTSSPAEERRRCSLPINKLLAGQLLLPLKGAHKALSLTPGGPDTACHGEAGGGGGRAAGTKGLLFGPFSGARFSLFPSLSPPPPSPPFPFRVIQLKSARREISKGSIDSRAIAQTRSQRPTRRPPPMGTKLENARSRFVNE